MYPTSSLAVDHVWCTEASTIGPWYGCVDSDNATTAHLDEDPTVLDVYLVGAYPQGRVRDRLPGLHRELPPVPGTGEHRRVGVDVEVPDAALGGDAREHPAGADGAGLVRAQVAQRVD